MSPRLSVYFSGLLDFSFPPLPSSTFSNVQKEGKLWKRLQSNEVKAIPLCNIILLSDPEIH